MYRRELFADIKYPVGRYYEDIGTTYKLLYYANRISFVNISTCEYFMRENSICHSEFQQKHLDFIRNLDEMESFLKEKRIYKALEREFKLIKLRTYMALGFYKIASSKGKNRKLLLNLKSRILNELMDRNLYLNKREEIYRFFINNNITIYIFCVKIEEKIKRLLQI